MGGSDVASRGKVATFPTSQAGNVDAHIPARGLLGCIPDPLKNFVSVKPVSPAAVKKLYVPLIDNPDSF